HDLVQLCLGEMGNEGTDQHRGFTLSDEGRSGSDDGLGTRHLHGPEEEDGELADKPLNETPVVKHLHEGDEEDDGREDGDQEPWERRGLGAGQERSTLASESKKRAGKARDEIEDIITNTSAKDEKRND